MDTIKICMGSSCFGRGNSAIVDVVTRFIGDHNLQDKVEVSGSLCMSAPANAGGCMNFPETSGPEGRMSGGDAGSICAQGPNIRINDKLISGVTADNLGDIITRELGLAL